jgi:hypothetical protein
MCEAIPPLPNTSSWCGAKLNTGTTLPLSKKMETRNIYLMEKHHLGDEDKDERIILK